jgi:hypothetical protein
LDFLFKPPLAGGFSCCGFVAFELLRDIDGRVAKVFNTTVDNAVEKRGSILVSDAARDGSAFCTGASAGTFVLQPSEG